MSLLDSGPQSVTVYPEVATTDEYGNRVLGPNLAAAVVVRGRWQASTAEETAELGQEQATVYRFISRTFPSGPYGRVDFDGQSWDVVAQPRHRRGSTQTEHFTTYLRAR